MLNNFARTLFFLFIIILSVPACKSKDKKIFNIVDAGAKADGITINTKNIQEAIDECTKSGGGTVYVPPGVFVTGMIELKSNVNLFLEAGAELKGSPDLKDYPQTEFKSEGRNTFLILGQNAKNISITGTGTINGNDSAFIDFNSAHPYCCLDPLLTRQGNAYISKVPDGPAQVKGGDNMRPGVLITLINCTDIRFENITIKNAPNWSVHFACCDGVFISTVKVRNSLLVPNADGFDVSTSKNVTFKSCDIEAGDDGIAISPCADGYCKGVAENIVVSDCIITSKSAGIRIGWSTQDIRNCIFQNLIIKSNRGICINTRNSETIENMLFSNIIMETKLNTGWWGAGEPIHISEIPLTKSQANDSTKKNGRIRNIRFSNMMLKTEAGIVFYGYSPNSIENITLENISMQFTSSPLNVSYGGNLDLRPAFDIKYGMFKSEIPAIYLHNVKGFDVNGFTLAKTDSLMDFHSNAIWGDKVEDVRINRFYGPALSGSAVYPAISLSGGKNIVIENSKTPGGSKLFAGFPAPKNIEIHSSGN